jgi:hypothetical protein
VGNFGRAPSPLRKEPVTVAPAMRASLTKVSQHAATARHELTVPSAGPLLRTRRRRPLRDGLSPMRFSTTVLPVSKAPQGCNSSAAGKFQGEITANAVRAQHAGVGQPDSLPHWRYDRRCLHALNVVR